MSSFLENGSSPSEVDSLDLDEVSYSSIFRMNHYHFSSDIFVSWSYVRLALHGIMSMPMNTNSLESEHKLNLFFLKSYFMFIYSLEE